MRTKAENCNSQSTSKKLAILILDEATSALDNITKKYIKKGLDYLMKDRTVIVVAHRLSILLHMDRILVFEKDKIVEDGMHKELLKNKKLYHRLWNAQTCDFIAESEEDIEDQLKLLSRGRYIAPTVGTL